MTSPHGQRITSSSLGNSASSRSWVFTYNNPTLDPEAFQAKIEALSGIRYSIFQLERGSSGTPHYQGYIEFSCNKRLSYMRRNLGTLHFEKRRGTRAQARDYCRKQEGREGGPWESGSFDSGGQGTRTDIASAAQLLVDTQDLRKVAQEFPAAYVKYSRGFEALKNRLSVPPSTVPEVYLVYGPTGIGKTRLVYDNYEAIDIYRKPPENRWFDGYDAQPVMLIDDFAGKLSQVSLLYLIQLIDRYPIRLEIKGNFVWRNSQKIILTTNYHPRLWYSWTGRERSYAALMRRITAVIGPNLDGDLRVLDKNAFFDLFSEYTEDSTFCHPIGPVNTVIP